LNAAAAAELLVLCWFAAVSEAEMLPVRAVVTS
jgi:hypothetical protein